MFLGNAMKGDPGPLLTHQCLVRLPPPPICPQVIRAAQAEPTPLGAGDLSLRWIYSIGLES
jgi:hypothetical protein